MYIKIKYNIKVIYLENLIENLNVCVPLVIMCKNIYLSCLNMNLVNKCLW